METIPSPLDVTTWQQTVAFCFFVAAVLVLPSVLTHIGNKRVKAVEKTLTTNNGGSHIKDQLDRIETKVDGIDSRVTTLESAPGPTVNVPNVDEF